MQKETHFSNSPAMRSDNAIDDSEWHNGGGDARRQRQLVGDGAR